MIQKLRLKFVAICMALVTAVLAVVFMSNYSAVEKNLEEASRRSLRQALRGNVINGNNFWPGGSSSFGAPKGSDKAIISLPYFTVELWELNGQYSAFITSGTMDITELTEKLDQILAVCLEQRKDEGVLENYHLRYLRQDNGLNEKISFVDMSMEETVLRDLLWSYAQIYSMALALLLGVSFALAYWATKPVEHAWTQQRQFLSDASHELKTPLTVILSNAELLVSADLEPRPARWAEHIHSESERMKRLVEEMLTLARSDQTKKKPVLTEMISLSDVALDCVLAFEPLAYEAGKPLESDIPENIHVLGDHDKLEQVISILLDNAIKYGAEHGEITLTLSADERQTRLTVSNPGEPLPPEQLSRLFERFYRADVSRGEQSGFGLGLSIASTIAREHQGTLKAESDTRSTRFTLTLPRRN